jgi:REP element-mobilizing transposase RayT
MDDYESLSHTKWECKYHAVFIPKYRRKVLYGELRQHLGDVFRKLALQNAVHAHRSKRKIVKRRFTGSPRPLWPTAFPER